MSPEKVAVASNQSPHIHQDVMVSRAIVTTPMHHSQVDPDQTHESVSHWGECAEQLRQARPRQLEEIRLDEGLDESTRSSDEQTVTRLDPALDFNPSDANRDLLGPPRHKSPDPLGALEASLSQHASVPASAHKPQAFPKEQSGKAFRIPRSNEPQVQQRGSQDTRTSLNPSPLFVQHSHKYKERNSRDPHTQRLRIWKEVSDKHRGLRKMEKRAETTRTSLTQAERQKLSPKKKGSKKRDLAAESARKEDPAPSKHPHQSKSNKKGQQPNQQGHPQSPDLHNNRQQRSPNAPSPTENPHLQHPIHNSPPHSETTPPPAPTFMPSSTPPPIKHIHCHHPPPNSQPDPPPAPTTHPSTYNAASHYQGCNVSLTEIERTTRFRYPKACPLCHTPRVYLPRPPQPQPTTQKLMLQQEGVSQHQAMAQANPVPDAYIPLPHPSEDRSLDALTIQNKSAGAQPGDRQSAFLKQKKRYNPADVPVGMNPRSEAKRAKVAEERNGYEDREGEYLRCEDGVIESDEYVDDDKNGYDDDPTVDEEECEQERVEDGWEGAFGEDGEVAIKSEDEV